MIICFYVFLILLVHTFNSLLQKNCLGIFPFIVSSLFQLTEGNVYVQLIISIGNIPYRINKNPNNLWFLFFFCLRFASVLCLCLGWKDKSGSKNKEKRMKKEEKIKEWNRKEKKRRISDYVKNCLVFLDLNFLKISYILLCVWYFKKYLASILH